MDINQQRAPRKKYSQPEEKQPSSQDPEIFLFTTGPSANLWQMHTMVNNDWVELMIVFDNEELILNFLTEFQDKRLQAIRADISKLKPLVEERVIRFVLNPLIKTLHDELFLHEGGNWRLTYDQLYRLVSVADKV
jgi:hypothetical protein